MYLDGIYMDLGWILYGFGMDLGRFGSLWMDFIWIYMDLDGFG